MDRDSKVINRFKHDQVNLQHQTIYQAPKVKVINLHFMNLIKTKLI